MHNDQRIIRRTMLALVAVGTLLGSIIVTQFYTLPVTTDGVRYDASAVHLLNTGEMLVLDNGKVYPPGYPFFLASIYSLFGHTYIPVYIIQFFLVGLCAAITFFLSRRYLDVPYWIALLTGLAVLLWPYMVLHAMLLFSEIVGITLLLASILLLYRFVHVDARWQVLGLSGVLLGLSTLVRPVTMLLPFWIAILWATYCVVLKRPIPSWRTAALFIVAFLVPLIGWSAYTYSAQGRADGVYSTAPGVFSFALNLSYTRKAPSTIEDLATTKEAPVDGESLAPLPTAAPTQPELSSILISKMKNVFLFWNPGAGGYQAQAYLDRYPFVGLLIWLYRIGFLVLLGLAFMTLRHWRDTRIALAWIVILYFWGVHTVLFPFPRYMLPVVPLVLILAAVSAYRLLSRVRGAEHEHPATNSTTSA